MFDFTKPLDYVEGFCFSIKSPGFLKVCIFYKYIKENIKYEIQDIRATKRNHDLLYWYNNSNIKVEEKKWLEVYRT